MQETLKFPQPVLPIRRRKMKAFFNTKSIVGRIVIVSLLAGGLVFASAVAVNMFVPTPTEASNCCERVELTTAPDENPIELQRCCSDKNSSITASSCSCGHANCPGGSCSCDGSSKSCSSVCGTCSCSSICDSGSFSCSTQGGTCTQSP